MQKKILVCVAWPYANGPLHLGHMAGSIMPADILARYHRMIGNRVLMVSGSDMHGAPITVKADRERTTPEKIAFGFHEINANALKGIGASFDLFTSTHTENHTKTVHEVFLKLLEKGYLERRTSLQFYCSDCERFLPDRYVEGVCPHCGYDKARGDQCDQCGKTLNAEELGGARCQLCSSAPSLRETEHFFLRLVDFSDALRQYLEDKSYWRQNVLSFTQNILEEGLQDRAITRDLTWGVPVPVEGYDEKRIYVWFEAVIGYLSASREWSDREMGKGHWEEFWKDPDCRSYYFIGKDNIIFHTIIWPAILYGFEGLNLPYDVPANEFMNLEGEKFSKSAGVGVDLPDMLENFQPDAIRYYLSVNMPELKDTDFSWDDFAAKINNELVATYGNFIHRVLSFTHKNFGIIPPDTNTNEEWKREVQEHLTGAERGFSSSVEACNFKQGLREFMDLARFGNQFFDAVEPWALLRKDRDSCGGALNLALQIVRALAVMAYPYLPHSAEDIWEYLGYESSIEKDGWRTLAEKLEPGTSLKKPVPLFKKIELPEEVSESDFSDFKKLNLKIGKIVEVSKHPNADKLYLLAVDIGKQINLVAGLTEFYSEEELMGKSIVIVSNLEPVTIRGVKSEGMLLAAETKSVVTLLVPEKEVPPGTPVDSGREQSKKRISFPDFQKLRMAVGEFDGKKVQIEKSFIGVNCDSSCKGEKRAFFVEGNMALALRCSDGTYIKSDREITPGAIVR